MTQLANEWGVRASRSGRRSDGRGRVGAWRAVVGGNRPRRRRLHLVHIRHDGDAEAAQLTQRGWRNTCMHLEFAAELHATAEAAVDPGRTDGSLSTVDRENGLLRRDRDGALPPFCCRRSLRLWRPGLAARAASKNAILRAAADGAPRRRQAGARVDAMASLWTFAGDALSLGDDEFGSAETTSLSLGGAHADAS